jgi:hypothetical protein
MHNILSLERYFIAADIHIFSPDITTQATTTKKMELTNTTRPVAQQQETPAQLAIA